jgi:opacity protein-like surface antigen
MNKYFKYELIVVVAVFAFGLTTVVLANGLYTTPPAPAEAPYFDGSYVGIGVGVVHAHADTNAESSYEVSLEPTQDPINGHYYYNKSHNFDMGKYGFNGNIFVGYGKTFESSPSYYLGGELFGNYFSPKLKGSSYSSGTTMYDSSYTMSINTEVKNTYSIGGDIRAGYLVMPRTMIYALFGLDYARFKVKSEFVFNPSYIGAPGPAQVNNDFSKLKLGYMPGIGMEMVLTDHFSLRAQYTYAFYSSLSNTVTKVIPQPVGGGVGHATLNTKIKPSRGLFTVKLSYLFN